MDLTKIVEMFVKNPRRTVIGCVLGVLVLVAITVVPNLFANGDGTSKGEATSKREATTSVGSNARAASGGSAAGDNAATGGGVNAQGAFTFNGPTQFGGQNNTMNVNRPAVFSPTLTWKSEGPDAQGRHRTRITIPIAPGGVWQAGTRSTFNLKLSAPCLEWNTPSFGVARQNWRTGPEKNTDVITVTTTSPPEGDKIVFDCIATEAVTVAGEGTSWSPLAEAQ